MELGLACKAVVVTGGSRGIGLETARLFAREGARGLIGAPREPGPNKPFLEVTDEDLLYGMAINFFAQFRICQRVVPMMIAQGGGRIVNVSGEAGIKVTDPPF